MINVAEITSTKGVEQAQKQMERAKNRMALEKKKANEERRRRENAHKYMMGGVVHKYFPECCCFEESEMNEILKVVSFIELTSASIEAFKKKAAEVTNEVVDIIKAVVKRHGRLQLPVYGGVFLRKIKNRERLQDADHMMRFASAKDITDFEKLDAFKGMPISRSLMLTPLIA